MNYASLEDAYGTPFGTRKPLTKQAPEVETPIRQTETAQRALSDAVVKSLPLDLSASTENFTAPRSHRVQEHFATPASAPIRVIEDDKLSRILRLVEQNRTGYDRPATQDMLLYVFTGVFFLFTLDSFVLLGKAMRD